MGGGSSLNIHHFYVKKLSPVDPLIQSLLPRYFSSQVTKGDLILCKKNWDTISVDLIPSFQEDSQENEAQIGLYFDSCRTWLYSLLYDGIAENLFIEERLMNRVHSFLGIILEIIALSLSQWGHSIEFEHQTLRLTKECCKYGVKTHHFIEFGPIFFHALSIVSISFSTELEKSWKNVYSSILVLVLPCCVEFREVLTIPSADGLLELSSTDRIRSESKPLPNDSRDNERNFTITPASRLRMQTLITNQVQL